MNTVQIQCPYCKTKFKHNEKEDYQHCPTCHAELICEMPYVGSSKAIGGFLTPYGFDME